MYEICRKSMELCGFVKSLSENHVLVKLPLIVALVFV